MTPTPPLPRHSLAPGYDISRIIVGGWQFSPGHGAHAASGTDPVALFARLVDLGYTTFDCADIYQGVEEFLGRTLRAVGSEGGEIGNPSVQIHTKFVPDLDILPSIDQDYVSGIVNRSLRRLGVERLDLLQFHWWDFDVPGYVETAWWLKELQDQGKIRHLAVTNFDRPHLEAVVGAGIDLVANQVQYSVLDRRPATDLADYCTAEGISLLCYGGLAGGFLSGAWSGMEEPEPDSVNRSLIKYHLIVGEMGGWEVFQGVLGALETVAGKHETAVVCVALAWVLDQKRVAATITGMDSVEQAEELRDVYRLELDDEDRALIGEALDRTEGPRGPVYALERDREGPHGRIMRYNLNSGGAG